MATPSAVVKATVRVQQAKAAPFPTPADLLTDVYVSY